MRIIVFLLGSYKWLKKKKREEKKDIVFVFGWVLLPREPNALLTTNKPLLSIKKSFAANEPFPESSSQSISPPLE